MEIFILAALNIVLIAVILFIALRKFSKGGFSSSEFDTSELIEFQHNLRQLIEELNRISETSIKEMNEMKESFDKTLAASEVKIREMKYLAERNRIMRQNEYKAEIYGQSPAGAEIPRKNEISFFEQKGRVKAVEEPGRKASKFMINESVPEKSSEKIRSGIQGENKPKSKYEHIHSLILRGMPVDEISKVTGLSKGEIELIKNLKK